MKRAVRLIMLAALAGSATGCFYPGDWAAGYVEYKPRQDPEYLAYLDQVKVQKLVFQVQASQDAGAWARAQRGFDKYAEDMGGKRNIRAATADSLEIAHREDEAGEYDTPYLFKVTRTPEKDMTRYEVHYSLPREGARAGVTWKVPWMMMRARIMAFYIVSGRIYKEAFLDERLREAGRPDTNPRS